MGEGLSSSECPLSERRDAAHHPAPLVVLDEVKASRLDPFGAWSDLDLRVGHSGLELELELLRW